MLKTSLREQIEHGTNVLPFAYYYVDNTHPRYRMVLHWHEECEFCKIIDGNLQIQIDGITYNGKSGDIFFINSGCLHSAIPNNCIYECFVFDLQFLLKERSSANGFLYGLIYNHKRIVPYMPFATTSAYIQSMLNELLFTLNKKTIGYELKSYGCLYYILGAIEAENLIEDNPNISSESVNKITKLKMAISYIQRSYNKSINLQDICNLLDNTPQSVIRLFKETIGKKPMEYVNSYRIAVACDQLKHLNKNVTQVALDCGFTDVSYFTKVFKKYTNTTPSQFINQFLKEEHKNIL